MRKLSVMSGPAAGHELELAGELVVGRENADLVIADHEMSRRHAVLRPVEQGVEVEDLGSLNGTYVDGHRISGPVIIAIRGAVTMGNSELRIDVSLPQVGAPFAATIIGEGPAAPAAGPPPPAAPPPPPPAAPVYQPPAAPPPPPPAAPVYQPPAAPPPPPPAAPVYQPPTAAEEESRVESPHLPIPASIAIFTAAVIALIILLVLTI